MSRSTVPALHITCFSSTSLSMSQQEPPPLHVDLLLADDKRGPWQPAPQLGSLWQRLRLLVITQLWTAYCTARSRPDRQVIPAHIAARVLAAARDRMRRDWLLVGSVIRLPAGVLSHWLRRRQPAMTQEQFSSAGAMETLSPACLRTCRSHPSSTGQPCTQCLCRSDAQA